MQGLRGGKAEVVPSLGSWDHGAAFSLRNVILLPAGTGVQGSQNYLATINIFKLLCCTCLCPSVLARMPFYTTGSFSYNNRLCKPDFFVVKNKK